MVSKTSKEQAEYIFKAGYFKYKDMPEIVLLINEILELLQQPITDVQIECRLVYKAKMTIKTDSKNYVVDFHDNRAKEGISIIKTTIT